MTVSLHRHLSRLLLALLVLGVAPCTLANNALEPITFQLRWHTQFQFAGYYAALEKGFYREAGFDVTLVEGAPGHSPVNEVLQGRAQYAEANSELLYARLQGKPLVALAVLGQHSPSVLLTRRVDKLNTPQDLIGKRVMMVGGSDDVDFLAMFRNEGIDPARIQIQPSSYDLRDLAEGRTDAFNAYQTNEPYLLRQLGFEPVAITPRTYGIDFYSDILFTTEDELKQHPDRVKRFRAATLKGWEYAFDHQDEIIDLVLNKYHANKTREHLVYEADTLRQLFLPDLIEIGHMNPGRWRHMADTFVSLDMAPQTYSLEGFIYDPSRDPMQEKLARGFKLAFIVALISTLGLGLLLLFNRRLQREIKERRLAEQEMRRMANYDALTGLPNRHLLNDRLARGIARAQRNRETLAVMFLDLDGFKEINDNYGHDWGDVALRQIAQRLSGMIRGSDTVARFGGDEFVILLEGKLQEKDIQRLSEQANRAIAEPIDIAGKTYHLGCSTGIALFPDDGSDPVTLIRQADTAMYRVKARGGGSEFFGQGAG